MPLPPDAEVISGNIMLCHSCTYLYPPALLKAMEDPFYYALGLRNGEVIFFECVESVRGEWVTVRLLGAPGEWAERCKTPSQLPPCPRGIDIRLSEIVWAADAPFGS